MSSAEHLDAPAAGHAVIRGGAVRAVGYAVGLVVSVAAAALLFRYLGVDDAGRYVTVLSLATIVGGLTDAGLTTIGVRELSVREGADAAAYLRSLLGLRIVLSALGAVFAVTFAAIAGYPEVMIVGAALASIGVFFQYLQAAYGIGLVARLRLGWVTAVDVLRQSVNSLLIVGLVLLGASLLPFLAVPIAASLASVALTVVLVRGDVPLLPAYDREGWRAILAEIGPYAVGVAVTVVYFRLAVVLMSLIASERETGYFGASFRIVEVLAVLPALIVSSAFPLLARAARNNHDRLGYALQRMVEVCTILGVSAALAVGIGAPIAIAIVAGSGFDPSIDVLRIQGLALAIVFITQPFTYTLLSLRMHREVLIASLVGLVVVTAATLVLGSTHGAQGAAVATVLSEAGFLAAAAIALSRRHARLRPSWAFTLRVAAAGGLGAAAGFLPGFPALPAVLVAIVVYVGALLALRAVPAEILHAILRREPGPVEDG